MGMYDTIIGVPFRCPDCRHEWVGEAQTKDLDCWLNIYRFGVQGYVNHCIEDDYPPSPSRVPDDGETTEACDICPNCKRLIDAEVRWQGGAPSLVLRWKTDLRLWDAADADPQNRPVVKLTHEEAQKVGQLFAPHLAEAWRRQSEFIAKLTAPKKPRD